MSFDEILKNMKKPSLNMKVMVTTEAYRKAKQFFDVWSMSLPYTGAEFIIISTKEKTEFDGTHTVIHNVKSFTEVFEKHRPSVIFVSDSDTAFKLQSKKIPAVDASMLQGADLNGQQKS